MKYEDDLHFDTSEYNIFDGKDSTGKYFTGVLPIIDNYFYN